jgi:hypothetical protein
VSVRREVRTGRDWDTTDELDRIDLVVSCPHFWIAIEKKSVTIMAIIVGS